jgi:single-strand DNA-binding protein
MSDSFSVTGLVATTPRHLVTQDGLPITSFRLAASTKKFDKQANRWTEGETNWFTVTSFRQLAINSATSVSKGDRVVVMGRLRVRDWDNGERAGTSVEIEAETLGHDLVWGSSTFVRTEVHYSNLYYGASLPAFVHLANNMNMALVGVNSAGSNAFFVRRDLLNESVGEVSIVLILMKV